MLLLRALERGDDKAVDDDASSDLYGLARSRLGAAGYGHYEVSNHAKQGHESLHNLAYWRGWDYVGVGPGAHGRLTVNGGRQASVAAKRPKDYITRAQDGAAAASFDALSPQSWGEEYVMMGLRINEGISLSQYFEITGDTLPHDVIDAMTTHGFLSRAGDRLIATQAGRAVLNTVSAKLLGA